MKQKRSSIGLLLDTNVWRYIADERAGREVARVAERAAVRVCIAPAVVYEALRCGEPCLRAALVRLMTDGAWHRLMPEAYDEAAELLWEVKRLRPSWLRVPRDEQAAARRRQVEADWSGWTAGFWDRARNDTDAEADRLEAMDGGVLSKVRGDAQRRRSEAKEAPTFAPRERLRDEKVELKPAPPGWEGTPIEPWRVDGAATARSSFSAAIQGEHPYEDWLSPDVDLSAAIADKESWNRFWFHEVQAERMPRCWLRWATEFLQRFRRVTDGTPVDSQLATYLIDVDAFATADKALADIMDRCSLDSPARLARPFRLSGGRACVAELLSLTKSLRYRGVENAKPQPGREEA